MKICDEHRIFDAVHEAANQIVWQYVTGGRAVHAFLPGHGTPLCGEKALRGPDHAQRPPRWHRWCAGMSPQARTLFWHRTRHHHQHCHTLAERHLAALRLQLHAEYVSSSPSHPDQLSY